MRSERERAKQAKQPKQPSSLPVPKGEDPGWERHVTRAGTGCHTSKQ